VVNRINCRPWRQKTQIGRLGVILKKKYIADLKSGDELDNELFLIQDVVRRQTRDGRPYLLCTVADRTGKAGGIFWDVPESVDAWLRPGLVVYLTGRAGHYRDALQITATDLSVCPSPNLSDLLPASARPRDEMIAELKKEIESLAPPWRQLIGHILLEPDFLVHFANAPAARTLHHAYIGGLLEHTLSMVTLCRKVAGHYPYVNTDLLRAGALLHDAGKAIEYNSEPAFMFSDDGRLVGHIVRAVVMVEQAAAHLGTLDPEDLRQLVHIIVSHHGTLEWGSPVVPKTLEAVLMHQIDLLDSRVQGFFDHLANDSTAEAWSVKPSYMFQTELRRPPGFPTRR
jgi:3'-5' exoribonuclease